MDAFNTKTSFNLHVNETSFSHERLSTRSSSEKRGLGRFGTSLIFSLFSLFACLFVLLLRFFVFCFFCFAVLAFLSSFVGKLGHDCKCVFCKGSSIVVRLVS